GNAKVFLSWNASDDAVGYHIKRAVSSAGPHIKIASSTANSYTDSGASNCSTYYYVVAATNILGASSDSSEVAASLGAFALAVNSGGNAVGHFIADTNVTGGTKGATVSAVIDTSGLTAPAPQAVYQAERYGNFSYIFTGLATGADYLVRLHS